MFYRVTRFEYAPERYDEILAWAGTKTDLLRGIDGLQFVETFVPGPGEGMVVAAYDNEDAFNAASETIMAVLSELGQFLTSPPMTSSGTVDWTIRA